MIRDLHQKVRKFASKLPKWAKIAFPMLKSNQIEKSTPSLMSYGPSQLSAGTSAAVFCGGNFVWNFPNSLQLRPSSYSLQ